MVHGGYLQKRAVFSKKGKKMIVSKLLVMFTGAGFLGCFYGIKTPLFVENSIYETRLFLLLPGYFEFK